MYALMAEWRALMDPATEVSVAHIKLDWWRGEIHRLAGGSPAHPITRYVAEMPSAAGAEFASLERSVLAAGAQVAGAPLERAGELASHSFSLYGIPLRIAAELAGSGAGDGASSIRSGDDCIGKLAAAEYEYRAAAEYRREVHAGRVPFPIDELLAAGIEDADLAADQPPPPLRHYLAQQRARAGGHFADAATALDSVPPGARSQLRHLSILARLGQTQVKELRAPSSADFRLSDLYNAWTAARHAARG
jgi:phytoene synthase